MRRTAHLLCALLLVLLPACGLLLEPGREIVAEVGGEPIRLKDFLLHVRSLDFAGRAKANDSDPEVSTTTRNSILRNMVVDRLMVLEAKDRGIIISEEEIAQALGSASQPQEADDEHTEEIQEGASGQAHKHEEAQHPQWEIEETRNRLLIEKLLDEELSDEAIREYYLAHLREDYLIDPPIISFEIVAVAPENKNIVDVLYKLATEKEIPLSDAYEALGRPPEVLEAGLTPPMPIDAVIPLMREKIEGMERFEVSEPFHFAQNGRDQYVVIRLLRKMSKKPLLLVKEEIKRVLSLTLIQNLQNKFGVQYYFDKLNYRAGE